MWLRMSDVGARLSLEHEGGGQGECHCHPPVSNLDVTHTLGTKYKTKEISIDSGQFLGIEPKAFSRWTSFSLIVNTSLI